MYGITRGFSLSYNVHLNFYASSINLMTFHIFSFPLLSFEYPHDLRTEMKIQNDNFYFFINIFSMWKKFSLPVSVIPMKFYIFLFLPQSLAHSLWTNLQWEKFYLNRLSFRSTFTIHLKIFILFSFVIFVYAFLIFLLFFCFSLKEKFEFKIFHLSDSV